MKSLSKEDLDRLEKTEGGAPYPPWFILPLIAQARRALDLEAQRSTFWEGAWEKQVQRIKELEESRDKAYTIGRHDGMRTAAKLMFDPFKHAKEQCDKIIEVFSKAGR